MHLLLATTGIAIILQTLATIRLGVTVVMLTTLVILTMALGMDKALTMALGQIQIAGVKMFQ